MCQRCLPAVVLVVVLFAIGCGASPTAPSIERIHLVLSGQSNAVGVQPALAQVADVSGWWQGGMPIATWAPDGVGWRGLLPTLTAPAAAFVWWQGEADAHDGVAGIGLTPDQLAFEITSYTSALSDLMTRVRQRLPNERIVILELGPNPLYEPIKSVLASWVTQDRNARYVRTNDLAFLPDQAHATAASYTIIAQRILDAAR